MKFLQTKISFETLKQLVMVASLVTGMVFLSGCLDVRNGNATIITLKGSDTLVNLAQQWAEDYMEQNADVQVQVSGGGTGIGMTALLNGMADVATASRSLKEAEQDAADSHHMHLRAVEVAMDGIAIIVHPSNPVKRLTLEQISKIFTGEVTNFQQVGGDDREISLYGRHHSSGTYEFLKTEVMEGREFTRRTQALPGTAALAEAVAKDRNGIAYGGVGYFAARDDISVLSIAEGESSPYVSPVEGGQVHYRAVWGGKYPISRYLYFYTLREQREPVKDFLNYILSKQGQQIVMDMEYIPLPDDKITKLTAMLIAGQ